jgi:hypothetical protein
MILKGLFSDKTRWQHFYIGIGLSVVFTILCCLGAMTAAEYKDKAYGGKWDWADWTCGMIGGIIGQAIQIVIIYIIYTWKWK